MHPFEHQDIEQKIDDGTILSVSSLLNSCSFSIWTCRILLFCFIILRFIIPKFRKSPCFWRSVLKLGSLSRDKRQGYKIAIALSVHQNDKPWGHAWIMKNGKSASVKPDRISTALTQVGSNELYEYYAAVPASSDLLSTD
ncbi:MAG: hypothetical protein V2B20_04085 [Pseudomonadota bacterium]